MKKRSLLPLAVLLFMFFGTSRVYADSGIFDNAIRLQVNGGAETQYYFGLRCTGGGGGCTGSNSPSAANFNGQNLGSGISSLKISWAEIRTFKNGGDDITGANLFYRVYASGGPAFTQEGISFGNDLGGGDQRWTETLNIELVSGLMSSTTYTLEIYSTASFTFNSGANSGTHFNNNSGSNFSLTFTTAAPMPVQMTRFDAYSSNKTVKLAWETASEHNNSFFEIQRSSDARNWSVLAQAASKNGNATYTQSYSYVDENPAGALQYYRLRQVDTDGTYEFSKVVQARSGKAAVMQAAPNPAGDHIQLRFEGDTPLSNLQILDAYGRLLREWNNLEDLDPAQVLPLDISDLPNGVLLIQMDGHETQRVIKQVP